MKNRERAMFPTKQEKVGEFRVMNHRRDWIYQENAHENPRRMQIFPNRDQMTREGGKKNSPNLRIFQPEEIRHLVPGIHFHVNGP